MKLTSNLEVSGLLANPYTSLLFQRRMMLMILW